jgi:hypothetical protein
MFPFGENFGLRSCFDERHQFPPELYDLNLLSCSDVYLAVSFRIFRVCLRHLLPPIGNKCRQFYTSLVQCLY